MASTTKEVAEEILPLIRVYKDGSIERLLVSPYVPPSIDPQTGVSSKDITISHEPIISARLYLPKLDQQQPNNNKKHPILVYFHGGGFCLGSAFASVDHRYLNSLVFQAQLLAISVEYRLAPEHHLPIAYEDSWTAVQWVTSHCSQTGLDKDPWLLSHGDFGRLFIGGDSAGANIVHNIAMRAGVESLPGNVKILGAFLGHPYFMGSKPIGNEPAVENHKKTPSCLIWDFVYPSAPFGIDNPAINPLGPGGASLAGLGCSKLLVFTAEKDQLRDRGVWYHNLVKESGWTGELELFEMEGEDHCFHVMNGESENAQKLIRYLASFLMK